MGPLSTFLLGRAPEQVCVAPFLDLLPFWQRDLHQALQLALVPKRPGFKSWFRHLLASHFPSVFSVAGRSGGLCLPICGRSPRGLSEMSPVQCLPFPSPQKAMPPGFPRACLPCSPPQEPQLWSISTLDAIRSTLGPHCPDTGPVVEEEGSKGIPLQALSSSLSLWGEEREESEPLCTDGDSMGHQGPV